MVARRKLLVAGAAGAASLLLPSGTRRAWASDPAATALNPADIPKYVTALVVPAAMPPTGGSGPTYAASYTVAVRQFSQQILPPGWASTTVWGYGSTAANGTFASPSGTIEATVDRPIRITWVNDLVDKDGGYLPHLLAVDPTVHWANPPGGTTGRDSMPMFTQLPQPYRGPVPLVTHLHGAHTTEESDGYPEAWYLPRAKNVPAGFAAVGSYYDRFHTAFAERHKGAWAAGTATFQYPNDQRAAALWFHDHALGITRLNLYAGTAGFYLLRGGSADLPAGVLPGPAPAAGDPPGKRYYEIPLMIQDRSFNVDGSLAYPSRRVGPGGPVPFDPHSHVPPFWTPAFFGKTMTVNGRTWPVLAVEPRRYRLRLLNACDSRFLLLKIAAKPDERRPAKAALPIWQIGSDGGLLPRPVRLESVLLGNAERADVVVDFTGLRERTELYLVNEAADGPSSRGAPVRDYPAANPNTTGQVMKFVVGRLASSDTSVPPEQLTLPALAPLGAASTTRRLSLTDQHRSDIGPVTYQLGTVDASGNAVPCGFADPVTENPAVGATEIWEFHNGNRDAHPIHIHGIMFQVAGRGADGTRPPDAGEEGFKDTVVAYPGELTRVKAHFDLPGRYVWHCNMASHEDNDMMRPYQVGPDTGTGGSTTGSAAVHPSVAVAGAISAAVVGGAVLARRRGRQSTNESVHS